MSRCHGCHAGSSGGVTARRWPRRGHAPQSARGVPWAPSGGLLSGHLFNVVAQQLILLWKREQRYFVEERWWHGQARLALLPGAVTTQNSIRSSECRLLKVRDDTALGHQRAACREVHSLEARSRLSWKRCHRRWPHGPAGVGRQTVSREPPLPRSLHRGHVVREETVFVPFAGSLVGLVTTSKNIWRRL